MDTRDKIISLLQVRGPSLPIHIAKEIGQDTVMASAHLSEMASNKKIVISSLKVGGSPLYYLPGQENRLQQFVHNLHEREQEAVALLRESQIIEDTHAIPVVRAALRSLKDFALPLNVTAQGATKLFWKWYLTDEATARTKIERLLNEGQQLPKAAESKSTLLPIKKEIEKKQEQKKLEPKKEEPKKPETTIPKQREPVQEHLLPEQPVQKPLSHDAFLEHLLSYFTKEKIKVLEQVLVRKGKEYDFVVSMPSAVGNLTYFVKARNKKNLSDGDLASAHVQGQMKKLPVILLSPGLLSKKAKEIHATELKGVSVVNKPWA